MNYQNNDNKDSIENLDQKIREALRAEDEELFAEFGGEQNVFEQLADSFRGRSRWFSIMAFAGMALLTIIAASSAYLFYQAETLRELIGFAGGFFFCLSGIGMMKVWFWMEMNKNTMTREIKRVELQIARLSARLK